MTITPIRFSASALIDMGGSGIRLDVARNDGEMFPDLNDAFRGAVNLRFTEVQGPLTMENILTQLADKFIEKRLKSNKFLQAVLAGEPLERTIVSTAGQIKKKGRYQVLTAAANMPAVLQDVNFLGAFRRIFQERMGEHRFAHLVDAESFNRKGRIINDALAGVMALARQIESKQSKPLNASTKPVVMLDVGSGIATGGISGNMLYTAESQNTRGLVPQSIIRRAANASTLEESNRILHSAHQQSLEDLASMRGMTWQTIKLLHAMPLAQRLENPHYQAIRGVALQRDAAKPAAEQQYQQSPRKFDSEWVLTDLPKLLEQSWKERWVNIEVLLVNALIKPEDVLVQTVYEGMIDGLAALASNKVMETGAHKVFVQFIDMDSAVAKVNELRAQLRQEPLVNPLPQQVQERMWESYLHRDIAATFFDPEKGVELTDLRNTEGTAYFAQAFGNTRKNPWQIKGVAIPELRKQV